MKKNLELRMYSLVMYNVSEIQKGIQAGHATDKYQSFHGYGDPLFVEWNDNHSTVMILNGGTSITMEQHYTALLEMDIKCSFFREPDLNNSMSAISFIVDERFFDRVKYPDFQYRALAENPSLFHQQTQWENQMGFTQKEAAFRSWLGSFRLA